MIEGFFMSEFEENKITAEETNKMPVDETNEAAAE